MRVNIHGLIIPNDYKWYYDYFEEDSTCPRDVEKAIAEAAGEMLEVDINSPGGEISSGSEIYTALRSYGNVIIHITGEACSAASVIAMAGRNAMSPTALMMVHRVSTSPGHGNHRYMERTAEMLRAADEALCSAYVEKAGMSREAALSMMEQETWLTAERAKELGLVDEILFMEDKQEAFIGSLFCLPGEEKMNRVRKLAQGESMKMSAALVRQKLNLLKLAEVKR